MPMGKPEDFGGRDMVNKYCLHCTDRDGNLKSYDEVVEGMAAFFSKINHAPTDVAKKRAIEHMSGFPAWRDKK